MPEWALVELQGLVQMRREELGGRAAAGDLHCLARSRQPVLVLGHHVLSGKEVKLDQPMAVMEKTIENDKVSYRVKAIVKKKLLFKSRPKPIISNVSERV